MPETGEYLLTHIGFSPEEKPIIVLQRDMTSFDLLPLEKTLSLRFDTSQRYCIGWRNMATGEIFSCPDHKTVENKFEQCTACQQKTGFNPAFYYAATVSKQQEARNREQHMLYLAHFAKGVVKVGISHAARNRARLLEQGARSALILSIFPTAHVARSYEAQIAMLPGIAETIQLRKKITSLAQEYGTKLATKELLAARHKVEQTIGMTVTDNNPMSLDPIYFPTTQPDLTNAYDCAEQNFISGQVIGMLGSLLFFTQQNSSLFLPLKKYIGYTVNVSYEERIIPLPARQMSLF
jgi:hypothetical protein